MSRRLYALALAVFCVSAISPVTAEQLAADLSEHQIAVRPNFTGTQILLFGAIEGVAPDDAGAQRDVVVVVSGPEGPVTVRRKERRSGIWVNYESIVFGQVPGYYAVASTRPLDTITGVDVRAIEKIGAENLSFGPSQGHNLAGRDVGLNAKAEQDFSAALIRTKTEQGLYLADPGGVTFLGKSLFRVTLDIPANVPVGLYSAKVLLFREGQVIDALSSPVYIEKSGLERRLYRFAQFQPFFYALFSLTLAVAAGWAASAAFRDQ